MEKIETEYKSLLKLNNIYVNYSEFRREDVLKSPLSMNFTFEHDINAIDNSRFSVVLKGKVFSKKHEVTAEVHVTASFEGMSDISDEKTRESLKTQNAIAIMFPYLRAQMTLISSQSGAPLVLPSINITAYFEDKKQKLTQQR